MILTHIHADFVAGHLEPRERTGCRIRLGARATVEYPFAPMREGDVVELGEVRLVALETPGHTPEAISLAVYDLARDRAHPHAVLTGDALFVGDVGRPDLVAARLTQAHERNDPMGPSRRGRAPRVAMRRRSAGQMTSDEEVWR